MPKSTYFPVSTTTLDLITQDNIVVVLNEWTQEYKPLWQVLKDRDWDYLWYGPSLRLSSSYYEDGVFYLTPRHFEEFLSRRRKHQKRQPHAT